MPCPAVAAGGCAVDFEVTVEFAYPDLCEAEVKELFLIFQGSTVAVHNDLDLGRTEMTFATQYIDSSSMYELMNLLLDMLGSELSARVVRISASELPQLHMRIV